MRKNIIRLLIILLFFSCSTITQAFAPQDIFSFTRITYVNPAPNGSAAAIATMAPAKKGNKWQWIYELLYSDGKTSKLTTDIKITAPTWSHDGKYLAYISRYKNDGAIYIIKFANGQKSKLITFNGSIESFKWSPDDKYIAFVAIPAAPQQDKTQLININLQKPNARLYLVEPGFHATARPITSDTYSISTGFNDGGFDWAPDGESIAFTSQPNVSAQAASECKIQIYILKTQQILNLPYLQDHYANQPLFSPDNKWLAFRSNPATQGIETVLKNNIFYLNKICVIDLTNFKNYCLADTDNKNSSMIGWNANSSGIYAMDFVKSDGERIYELNLDPKIQPKMISVINGFIEPLTISLNAQHNTFGFGYENVNEPPEAYISPADNFKLIPMTHLNQPVPSLGDVQDINWRGADGAKIEGLLITPKNYDPLITYPLVVWVHGGPVGAAWKRYLGGCDEYSDMIEPSSCWGNYLNAGYVIFSPNYRGSTGYGSDFRFANYRDFGGNDFQDIQAGVDYLIAKKIADPDKLLLAGWSYGGYMANWTITQTTRYKAAVVGDGLSDLLSFAGTSDIPFYASVYLGSYLWDDSFLYVKRSPILYVNAVQTPLLIFSGQRDTRVPIEQSIEMYTALKNLNKSVTMFVLPDQGHVPTDPGMILGTTIEINKWFNTTLGTHEK